MTHSQPMIMENFMFRFPSISFQGINRLYEFEKSQMSKKEIVLTLIGIEEFKTAIRTASPNLYSSLNNIEDKNAKEIRNIYYSLIKYYIRIFSRPTPFSTFSSVGIGTFVNEEFNELTVKTDSNRVNLRLSHEWLYKFISNIEKDLKVFKHLTLKSNKLISHINGKYQLNYFSEGGTKSNLDFEEISLPKTPLLAFTLNSFSKEIKTKDIVKKIIHNNQAVTEEQVLKYIQGLAKKDFLISNLRISNSVENIPLFILNFLKELGESADKYYDQLYNLQNYITEIDTFNSKTINQVEDYMKGIAKAPEYIHIDTFHNESKTLPNSIKQDLSNYAKLLVQVSNLVDKGSDHMDFYLSEFIDNYGLFNAISIKMLLEDKTELGPPPTYTKPLGLLDYEYNKLNNKMHDNSFLKTLLYTSLLEGSDKIDISEYLENNPKKPNNITNGSFDMYLSIYAKTKEELYSGDYSIYPSGNIASPFAGRTMGRFLDMFPEHKEIVHANIYDNEGSINPEKSLANLNISPINGKSSNVMNSSNKYDYEISISSDNNPTKTTIELDDLYIYSDGEKFHVMSKSLNETIVPLTSHMVNHQHGMPNFYRFLIDVTLYKRTPIIPFSWGEFGDLPYLPSVTHGNHVLTQRSWYINLSDNEKNLDDVIKSFFSKYNVPRYVRWIDFDNYIFIDTQSSIMMDVFKNELTKKKELRFIEANEMNGNSIINDEHGENYINEIIISAFQKGNKEEIKKQDNYLNFYTQKDRLKMLGSDWIYLKIYHPVNGEYEILTTYVKDFFKENFGQSQMYFIRYTDPYPHIRLRIKVEQENLYSTIERLNLLTTLLLSQKLASKATYDIYNREIERYGGNLLIDKAEDIFCVDSKIILELLPCSKLENYRIEDFALTSLGLILSTFIKEIPIHQWLESNMEVNNKYYKSYRKYYKSRQTFVNEATEIFYQLSHENLKELNKNINLYIQGFVENNYSDSYFNHIVLSILHMHLNRYGIHSDEESMIMNFLYYQKKEEYMRLKNEEKQKIKV